MSLSLDLIEVWLYPNEISSSLSIRGQNGVTTQEITVLSSCFLLRISCSSPSTHISRSLQLSDERAKPCPMDEGGRPTARVFGAFHDLGNLGL